METVQVSLYRVLFNYEIRPTQRTIIMIFHPLGYTFLMKNVITLIRLSPGNSLARFVRIQTNGAFWFGKSPDG
jgi:hypothetical protein